MSGKNRHSKHNQRDDVNSDASENVNDYQKDDFVVDSDDDIDDNEGDKIEGENDEYNSLELSEDDLQLIEENKKKKR
jgi:hypothetical protein